MYTLDERLLTETPEVRIGDEIYKVDNRMSTFLRLSSVLSGAKNRAEEFDAVMAHGLGAEAAQRLAAQDLSVAAAQSVIVLTLAAMQGITEDEARARFRG